MENLEMFKKGKNGYPLFENKKEIHIQGDWDHL